MSNKRPKSKNSKNIEVTITNNNMLSSLFKSGTDKKNKSHEELKALLIKYNAEMEIQDFSRNWDWVSDEKIVVNFGWDEDLLNRTGDGRVPQLVIGVWENGK